MDIIENLQKTNDKAQGLYTIANTGLEIGLKAILPDFIEDDVLDIKDKFVQEGFSKGIQEIINKGEDIGKSIQGIFTGKFETVEQIKRLVQTDGILDGASDIIDKVLKSLVNKKKISKSTYNLIKTGKKEILNSLENELEGYYKINEYSLENLSELCQEWKESYKREDYSEMEKNMKKIKQKLNKNLTIETIINEARNLEKIQKYIEEKGSLENLTENEKILLEKIK